MSANRTTQLVDELAADLTPVSPVPPLWLGAGGLLVVGSLLVAGVVALNGGVPTAWAEWPADASWRSVLLGLAVVAVAGCFGGLASAIPGRSGATRSGVLLVGVGLVMGLGVPLVSVATGATGTVGFDERAVGCLGAGVTFALAPALLGVLLARRAWSLSPGTTAVLLLLGTTALGALAVHLMCPMSAALHVVIGHNGVPLVATAVLVPLAAVWIRRPTR